MDNKDISSFYFNIADFIVSIEFLPSPINNMGLIPSLESFRINSSNDNILFNLRVDDSLKPIDKNHRERIRKFDTGNGDTIVDLIDNGGYQFIIKDTSGNDCCLLLSDKTFTKCTCALNGSYDMRCFGLNNALMLVMAFATSFKNTVLIHASSLIHNEHGYAFIAKSGTGKSTQVSNWINYIEGSQLLNDDNPIIRIVDSKPYIYGSPWSGKTPCYRNIKVKLGAIIRIDRAKQNCIDKLSPLESFASVLPSCSSMKWDKDIFDNICNTITKIVETTDIYTLHCLPNKESALICCRTISK
jgi:hypothetical protein